MATIWCKGEWLDSGDSKVAWSDRGLMHGLGLFETLLAVDGRPVHSDRHLTRMAKGLDRLSWNMPDYDLVEAMAELLERNELSEGRARIRLAMTAGSGALADLAAGEDFKIWMTASRLTEGKKSVSLGLSPWKRNEHSPLSGLKCASYADNLIALDWARVEGLDEVLFLNTGDHLCEAATANLFLVQDGELLTPDLDSGCLPGVAREVLIGMAESAGIKVVEGSLQLDDLQQADECFLTSATRGVIPVSRFDGREFHAGQVSARLAILWEESVSSR